jgi:hypothetical protein
MEPKIPPQIRDYPLIRVCRPDECRSHNNCTGGKRPVTSADDFDSVDRIKSWLNRGGNYGVVPQSSNDLVIYDVDSEEMSRILNQELPSTFRVRSGGNDYGEHWYYQCAEADSQRNWDTPEGGVNVKNWQVVAPGSIHGETGNEYEVIDDSEIATISANQYQTVYNILTEITIKMLPTQLPIPYSAP